MSGYGYADFPAGLFLNLCCHFIGNGRIRTIAQFLFVRFLGELGVFFGNGALCYRNNGEAAAVFMMFLNGFRYFINIIRNFRNKDDVRTACHAGIQGQPAYLVSHNFYNKNSAVGCRSGMNAVNGICCNVNRTLETEGHIRTPQIIINGLGQGYHIQAFFTKKICGLVGAVAA